MKNIFQRAAKAVSDGIYPPMRKVLCGKYFECLSNKKHGFTLAEILISLLILGVIASLTIPSLIQNTQKKEEVVKIKKGLSVLNQAVAMDKALSGEDLSQYENCWKLTQMFPKRLSATYLGEVDSNEFAFKTQDGLIFNCKSGMENFNANEVTSKDNYRFTFAIMTERNESYKYDGSCVASATGATLGDLNGCYFIYCGNDICIPSEDTAAIINSIDPTKAE